MLWKKSKAHAPDTVGAIGHAEMHPNSRNMIPGRAVFTIDFRSPSLETLLAMEAELPARAPGLCAALRLGFAHRHIVSGARHDAC